MNEDRGTAKKNVIYTAITGNYDNLKEPKLISENFDYVCFTDNSNLKSKVWKIIQIDYYKNDLVKTARRYKILPHLYFSDYEYSIWIDGGFKIVGDIDEFIDTKMGNQNMMYFKHRVRNCIYDESKKCIDCKKDKESIIRSQMKKYKLEGYPRNEGLIESGVIVRKHNDTHVIKLMEDWWAEVDKFSKRDQLSFNFVAWKNHAEYVLLCENIVSNKYFRWISHLVK